MIFFTRATRLCQREKNGQENRVRGSAEVPVISSGRGMGAVL